MDFMYKVLFVVFFVLIGAAFGSFACCQAWRMRMREEGKKNLGKRSVCLECGHRLKWYENVPILSWVLQKGKCRKCGAEIGKAEILAEVLGAVSFGLIMWRFMEAGSMDALAIGQLVVVVIFTTLLIFLAVYDGKWGEMPVLVLIYAIVVAGAYVVLGVAKGEVEVWSLVGSVSLLAGVYYLLYFFSKEKLVGGGDWMLCLAIGLVLGKWQLALVELFLANFLGAIAMLPQKKKRIAFGPFLVVAFVVIFVFSELLLNTLTLNFN